MKANIAKRVNKGCAACGVTMPVVVYKDKKYRGGHYFGKHPVYSRKELKKMWESGTHTSRIGDMEFDVLNYDEKPSKYVEYWECPRCYWGKRYPRNDAKNVSHS